jgi:hypothetical protein
MMVFLGLPETVWRPAPECRFITIFWLSRYIAGGFFLFNDSILSQVRP